MEEAEMADTTTTTTEPTTTTTEPASGGATQTSQGTFVQPTTQPAAAAPSPADVAKATAKTAEPASKTTEPAEKNDSEKDGKGSKDAVLADLARERDERQQAQEQLNAVLEALGLNKGKDTDPEQLASDLQAQRAENAVLRAGHGIADTDALLDSRRFTDSLTKVDVTDSAAVKAHIEAFINDHPRYATTGGAGGTTPGVRDAAAAPTTASTETDWLRAAIRR